MTLQESVSDRAKWLDSIKPEWYKLVPLEDGKVDMRGKTSCCVGCVLDYVFMKEGNIKEYSGFSAAVHSYPDEIYVGTGVFADNNALPFWKQEIAARLAVFTPSVETRELMRVE